MALEAISTVTELWTDTRPKHEFLAILCLWGSFRDHRQKINALEPPRCPSQLGSNSQHPSTAQPRTQTMYSIWWLTSFRLSLYWFSVFLVSSKRKVTHLDIVVYIPAQFRWTVFQRAGELSCRCAWVRKIQINETCQILLSESKNARDSCMTELFQRCWVLNFLASVHNPN